MNVPHSNSYGIYISQFNRFARMSSHVTDISADNKSLTAKPLQQGLQQGISGARISCQCQ